MWTAATGKDVRTLTAHAGRVSQVAIAPDGMVLASAGQDGFVRLWEMNTGRRRRSLGARSGVPLSVAFSPDGKTLACGTKGGRIVLWDVETGWERGAVHLKQEPEVRWLAFHPDGQTLASCSHNWDGDIRLWDLTTLQEKARLDGVATSMLSCAWRADGRLLASAGWGDGTIRLWDTTGSPPAPKVIPLLPKGEGALFTIAFSPEGRYLATSNPDGSIYLLRLARPGEVLRVQGAPR
jgi:WD40 repeat protein